MITLLVILGCIITNSLIGHLVWRYGLKVDFDMAEMREGIVISHTLWPIAFCVYTLDWLMSSSMPGFFQNIIDKNDPVLKARKAREEARAIEAREQDYMSRITELEIDNDIPLSYPDFAKKARLR